MKPNNLESQIKREIAEELLYRALSEEIDNEQLYQEVDENIEVAEEVIEKIEYEYEEDDDDEVEYKAIKKSQKAINEKKRKVRKRREEILKSDLKIKTVIILVMTLLVNTYAWFIYVDTVSTKLQMHIKGWNFNMTNVDPDNEFLFQVEEVYPGMDPSSKTMTAQNLGETHSTVRCEFEQIRVFDDVYRVGQTYTKPDGSTAEYTSDDLFDLLNSYPFKTTIYFECNSSKRNKTYNSSSICTLNHGKFSRNFSAWYIKFEVTWDYEIAGDADAVAAQDAIDTEWGEKAYEFKKTNTSDYCVEVKLRVVAEQADI